MSASAETIRSARDDLLAVTRRADWLPSFPFDTVNPLPASVLVLFGRLDSIPARSDELTVPADLDVLLQRRAATLSSHPGQVSFPGGRQDDGDADVVATALREAEEETGLDPNGVEVLGALPEIPLAVSNYLVTPVLGWWRRPSRVAAVDHAETVDVFRVPVAQMLDPASRYTATLTRGGQTYRGPAFDIDGTVVWGFTAGILDALFDATGWALPWDRAHERPVSPSDVG
ncbi:CoA pyrophosphatase [Microbacterium esteraromaticum]|uniref:CoA pyrophosphatase n=1 Tax=Microbacterium esteraromaticum TaxID=57043 RepID=A0A939ISB7_9MICO|nr:CoA pyrophosphatase [Microbacterium esteraromaticum]MBN8205012.1 CoA pyrophosphatase [Microbacterium esteraromaticum]MBN8415166.1 CoA pyrophosphatase [Microbacterium esteraromaticum]MBN8424556.1 CoA pyrophosphatase [Microbacterium esteraromaticum]MBY6059971.1 CoA pyrophosphatase [Microbacterium esteraromaticum]